MGSLMQVGVYSIFRMQVSPIQKKTQNFESYDFQDALDKLMHFIPQLSDYVHLKGVF